MRIGRSFALAGTALALAFGLAACGGGSGQQAQTTTAAPVTAQTGGGTWYDPKAPRGGMQRSAGVGGGTDNDWDDDWDN